MSNIPTFAHEIQRTTPKAQQMWVAKFVLEHLWKIYSEKVAAVPLIEQKVKSIGEVWSEDHIAFRTLPGQFCGAQVMQKALEVLGYERKDSMRFEDKKLNAFWMCPPTNRGLDGENFTQPPQSKNILPKVFVSEIEIDSFSMPFQSIVKKHASQVEASPLQNTMVSLEKLGKEFISEVSLSQCAHTLLSYFSAAPTWQTPLASEYEVLRAESEYAAWTLVFGNIPNHFTVSVHLMKKFPTLVSFHEFIEKELNIPMNTSGGIVKGSQNFKLEQCATLAASQSVKFQEGLKLLPYAFVEFAFRFPLDGKTPDGTWENYYQGFVVSNADKIFESTDVKERG